MSETLPIPSAEKIYPPELKAILERANAGDVSVLPQLKRMFDQHPELTAKFGDLVQHAEQALLTIAAGNCLTAREAISRQIAELRCRLAADADSVLEKLLVDRVCLCWLAVYHADIDLAQHLASFPGASAATQAAQRRLDGANRRFSMAVKTLAMVQKLVGPSSARLHVLSRPLPKVGMVS